MTEKGQIAFLIDTFTNLQRIKAAADREKEIDNQIMAAKAKLEVFGVDAEILKK